MVRLAEARAKIEPEVMAILDPIQQDRVLGLLIQLEDGLSLMSVSLDEALGIDSNSNWVLELAHLEEKIHGAEGRHQTVGKSRKRCNQEP